jgi:hypothetical protein
MEDFTGKIEVIEPQSTGGYDSVSEKNEKAVEGV